MNRLIDILQDAQAAGTYIGFSLKDDTDGELWGRVASVGDKSFMFQEVDPYGFQDGETEYSLDAVLYVDMNPTYAARLKALQGFQPSLPAETDPVMDPTEIRAILEEANILGEVIRISYPDTEDLDVTILGIDDTWTKFTYYDELMNPKSTILVRTSEIEEVTWRNARSEADTFLLKNSQKRESV